MSTYQTLPLVALAISDPRTEGPDCLWWAETTATQAGPRPAVDTADQGLVIEAAGAVDQGLDIDLQIVRGGMPGSGARAATVAHRVAGGEWRGHDLPLAVGGVARVKTGTIANLYRHPSIASLPDGTVALAWQVDEATGDHGIAVALLAPGADTFGAPVLVHDDAAESVASARPCIIAAGTDLLLLHWVEVYTGGEWSIRCWRSTDSGATWALHGAFAVDALALTPGRLTAAHHRGQTLIVGHLVAGSGDWPDRLYQWASADLCASASLVWSQLGTDAADAGGYPCAVVHAGRFVTAWASPDAGGVWSFTAIGAAAQPLDTGRTSAGHAWNGQTIARSTTAGGYQLTDADLALSVDDAGLLWLHWRYCDAAAMTNAHRCHAATSEDGGYTTQPVGMDPTDPTDGTKSGCWWLSGDLSADAQAYPTSLAATYHRGRLLLAAEHTAATSSADRSVSVWRLGGWSTLTQPPISRGRRGDRGHWWRTWAPLERPDDLSSITTTTGGTSSATLTDGVLVMTTTVGGGSRRYTDAANAADLAIAEIVVDAVDGGSTSSPTIAARLRASDGSTYGVEVELRVAATSYALIDRVSGTTIGTASGLTDGPRAYRIALSGGAVKAWHLDAWSPLAEASDWAGGPAGVPTDDGGAGGGTSLVWGVLALLSPAVTAHWHLVQWASAEAADPHPMGYGLARWDAYDAATAPDYLQGATLTTLSPGRYLADGQSVRGTDGPASVGAQATLSPAYDYPLARLFPATSRSPRSPWRSTTDTAEQIIALHLGSAAPTFGASRALSSHLTLILRGANWRTGRVQAYDGTTWATVAEVDLAGHLGGVGYQRSGGTIRPSSSATAAGYLAAGELTGHTWAAGSIRRRVTASSEGRWSGTAGWSGPRAVATLDGAEATDPTTGTCSLWSPVGAVVWAAGTAQAFRLIIDAQTTADGYLALGSMLLRPLLVPPAPPDWQSEEEAKAGHRRRRLDDGSIVVSRPAPPARSLDLAWTGGVDESGRSGASAAPAYTTVGTSPHLARSAWVESARSLILDRDGEQVAALVGLDLAALPVGPTTLTRRAQILVGSLTTSHRAESVLGAPAHSRVQRLAALRIEEDP